MQAHDAASASTSMARARWCSASPSRRTARTSATPRWSTWCASCRSTAPRSTSTIRGPMAAECKHEYGLRPVAHARAAARTMRPWSRWRTRSSRELGAEGVRSSCKKNHVLYDIKHVFRGRPTVDCDGRLMKILVTGAAGFIGFHTSRRSCWRAATRSSASTTSTSTTTSR